MTETEVEVQAVLHTRRSPRRWKSRVREELVAVLLLALTPLVGCQYNFAPTVAPERPEVEVPASYDDTWTALVDVFAEHHLKFSTLDKASGLIVGEPFQVPADSALAWASCGGHRIKPAPAFYHLATHAEWNVRVRSQPPGSTVRVTVRWEWEVVDTLGVSTGERRRCETTNAWESRLESLVQRVASKQGAE